MRQLFVLLVTVSILYGLRSTYAQSTDYNCGDLTNAVDLSLCEPISHCDDSEAICLQKGVAILLQECHLEGLSDCEIRSIIYWVIDHHIWFDGYYLWHPEGFEPSFRAVASNVDEGDYESALLEFDDIANLDDYNPYFTLELVHGVLLYANGDYEQALEHFDNSIHAMPAPYRTMLSKFDNPLAYYYRGQIYRSWGNEARALQDFYLYDVLALPELKALLPLNSFNLSMQNPKTWTLYPVYGHSTYWGWYVDYSQQDARNILISYSNNQETLIVARLLERRFLETPDLLFLERDPDNPSNYFLNLNAPDSATKSDSYHLKISVKSNYIEYYETIWHSEGLLTEVGILSPSSQVDIRQNVTNRLCEGNALSFIKTGDRIVNLYYELSLTSDPNKDNEIALLHSEDFEEVANPFIIQDGPECLDGKIWWQVSNGTLSGWLYENDANAIDGYGNKAMIYWIMPYNLLESWKTDDNSLTANIPTPLQFLGLTQDPN